MILALGYLASQTILCGLASVVIVGIIWAWLYFFYSE